MVILKSSFSILHVLAPARFGGLETVVATLAPAQAAAGDRVTVAMVLTPEDCRGHPLPDRLRDLGVATEVIEVGGRDYRGERRAVAAFLDAARVDVLHTHGYRPDVIDTPMARRAGVPTVTTVHGYTGGGWRNRAYEWLQTRSFRKLDAVVAVSEKLARDLREKGLDPARIHTVRNAWRQQEPVLSRRDARRHLSLAEEGAIIGWVGRLSPEKAPDIMVRALTSVGSPESSVSFVGSGPMEPEARRLADELGLSQRIRWHGSLPGAGTFLRAFDVLVLTSWTEGTPMVLLEAMSAGVPVVTTNVGGIPDVVSMKEAQLCTPGRPDQIAAAIDLMLSNGGLAASQVDAAKRRLDDEFAVEPWVQRYRDIYQQIQVRR